MTNFFSTQVYLDRIHRVQMLAQEKGLSGLIIGSGAQLIYLTGSRISTHERLLALVIPAHGTPTLVLPAVDRGDIAKSPLAQLGFHIITWEDGENPHHIAITALALSPTTTTPEIALGSELSADHVLALMALLPHASFSLATSVLAELFIAKDSPEIADLRFAGEAIDRVHAQVPELLRAGRTEKEVAKDLEQLILREHKTVDFVIVGSAENGANPHHDFSDRVLTVGDMVVVDIGGTTALGYHSDCTRTYIVGGLESANPDALAMYEVLFQAQKEAVQAVRPGVTAHYIDNVARQAITQAGYGEYFIHRTGHGIGLSTHEEPFIMAGNDLVLSPGMAFSIEPGIYIPHQYGARIEDIVVVTDTACELLNNQPRILR
ncbi:M24 family metallopeptidase [Corynebacterium kutscheri]|uniref:M24 family metallopeptidase n=1 Tax=Corynebacterium kutscheri TaxID=35755 RepID=UPI0037BF9D71